MRQKTKRGWFFLVLIFFGLLFFNLAGANFDPEWIYWEDEYENYEIIRQDTLWKASENRVIEKTVLITNGATLTVEKGAKIKFQRDPEQWASAIIVDQGRILAEGTEKEPVIFTSDQTDSGYFFFFNDSSGQESFFRYATIEKAGGGYEVQTDWVQVFWKKWFLAETARAGMIISEETYPVHYYRGKVRFENCVFNNSNSRVEIKQEDFVLSEANYQDNFFQVINSNFMAEKDQAVLASDLDCDFENMELERIDEVCWGRTWLKNNWYGQTSGPYLVYDRPASKYPRINSQCMTTCSQQNKSVLGLLVNLDGQKDNELIADPVVIIPGINGSEIDPKTDQWVLDPILHTYDNLWESLKEAGFRKEKTLFAFPYQWRQKNELSAFQLKAEIDRIKTATGARRVDLVGHSMGGLVARYYLESDGSDESGLIYEEDIDQLITLGTPHHGAPEAYLKWEAGEGFFSWKDKIARNHFRAEAKHAGYPDIFSYIRARVPSVGQLLPDSVDYLSGAGNFAFGYPQNFFLQKLNQPNAWAALVQKIRLLKIIGHQQNADDTIVGFRLVESEKEGLWEDGMPENFYSDQVGIFRGTGDETVPLFSARGPVGGATQTLDSSHRDLPKEGQCEVAWELGAKICVKKDLFNFPNLLYFNVFSPVDIQVINPQGQRIGKDFVSGEILNEIEGAFYSGFETENEFITVPLQEGEIGEFQILIQGVASSGEDREYSVVANLLKEGGQEEKKTFSGSLGIGEEKSEIASVSESGLEGKDQEEEDSDETLTARQLKELAVVFWEKGQIDRKVWHWLKPGLGRLIFWEKRLLALEKCPFLKPRQKDGWLKLIKRRYHQELEKLEKKIIKNKNNFHNGSAEKLLEGLALLKK